MIDPDSSPPCGWHCTDCSYLGDSCPGCRKTGGRPFWTANSTIDACPVYACCNDAEDLEHCGLCDRFPCRTFREWHDPSMTETEVRESLMKREKALRTRALQKAADWPDCTWSVSERRTSVPIITVEGPPVDDIEEKRKLVRELTDAALGVFEVPPSSIVVLLKPNSSDNVACAGELISDRLERTGS